MIVVKVIKEYGIEFNYRYCESRYLCDSVCVCVCVYVNSRHSELIPCYLMSVFGDC